MEPVNAQLGLERQVHSLRMGLKAVCVTLSLFLVPATWLAIVQCVGTREMLADLGSAAMPVIVRLAFLLADFQIPLLIISLVLFLTVVFCSLRYRSGAFLLAFALHVLVAGMLISIMLLSTKLAMLKVVQNMQNM